MSPRLTTVLAIGVLCLSTTLAQAEKVIYLNFGEIGTTSTKSDQNICDDSGGVLITLKKGPREGFAPTDIGYADNDARAAIIQQIINQVTADYGTGNITFTTTSPGGGTFTTINIVKGNFPNHNFPADENGVSMSVDVSTNRLTINGGVLDGYYIDLSTGNLHRPNGTQVPGKNYPDLKSLGAGTTLGIAQEIDRGNKNANKQAWIFVGGHTSGTSTQNRNELGNSISHELAHLLGLEHSDGVKGSIMGDLNGSNYGNDKSFTDGSSDATKNANRKLAAVLSPKQTSIPRVRVTKIGDVDQHGTSEPEAPINDPDTDASEKVKEARRALQPHVVGAPILVELNDIRPDLTDPPNFDTPLQNGSFIPLNFPITPSGISNGLMDWWFEIDMANLADVTPGADFGLCIEGQVVPGAFNGIDQRTFLPEHAGYAFSHQLTVFLTDHFADTEIAEMLSDGVVEVLLTIGGDTPFVSVDSARMIIVDNGPVPCAADLTGDATVNVNDLLLLIGAWGTSGPSDLNGNGITNVDDLLILIGQWGPCQIGGCCLPDTNCIDLVSSADCAATGGTYLGNGTTCESVDCPQGGLIPAGTDCYYTACGDAKVVFCEEPIPADFFGPGSDPFIGDVFFGGQDPSQPDTQVRRLCEVQLGEGDAAQIPIEIISLDLVSCDPITVTFNGGLNPQDWDVEVDLSVIPPPRLGNMFIQKTHPNGGVFNAEVLIQPRFTFTRVGGPEVVVLDSGIEGYPAEQFILFDNPQWIQEPTGDIPGVCASNFIPGVEDIDPGSPNSPQCCRPVCGSGFAYSACSLPGPNCDLCVTGACCLPSGQCQMALDQIDCEDNLGGFYFGDGTNCFDSDGDGLADVQESGNCCEQNPNPCRTGSHPLNPDSDFDGFNDECEVQNGSNPCDPFSTPGGGPAKKGGKAGLCGPF